MKDIDLILSKKDNLVGTEWNGVVVDNDDPQIQGRCKIRIFSKFDNIPDEDLPWAFPANNLQFAGGEGGYGVISVPKIGTIVKVKFNNGDIYAPEYYSIQNINKSLQSEIANSYTNSHSIVYDEDENMKIIYIPERGLQFFLKDSQVRINPNESITIEHSGTQSIIELEGSDINITSQGTINVTSNNEINQTSNTINETGNFVNLGASPVFSDTRAEPLWAFLLSVAVGLDAKFPPTPGKYTAEAAAAQQSSTSTTVKTS